LDLRSEFLISVNHAKDEVMQIYKCSPAFISSLDSQNQILEVNKGGKTLNIVEEADLNDMTVKGTWMGLASQTELFRWRKGVEANRNLLTKRARQGSIIVSKLSQIALASEDSYHRSMSKTDIDEATVDSQVITSILSDDLEEFSDELKDDVPDSVEELREQEQDSED
jgi:hypothetical protein